jgi:hypothetical protein
MSRTPIVIILLAMATGQPAAADTSRLVLQITVDGLRGDLINRYRTNFGKGGFN